jgi:RimJ/RimL family protein N-acetyltransferase
MTPESWIAWHSSPSDLCVAVGFPIAEGALPPPSIIEDCLPSLAARRNLLGVWGIADGVLAGSAMFKFPHDVGFVEFGYGVAPTHENLGIATAMVGAMIELAGDLQVFAHTLPENLASQRVLEKNGFVFSRMVTDPEDGLVRRYDR